MPFKVFFFFFYIWDFCILKNCHFYFNMNKTMCYKDFFFLVTFVYYVYYPFWGCLGEANINSKSHMMCIYFNHCPKKHEWLVKWLVEKEDKSSGNVLFSSKYVSVWPQEGSKSLKMAIWTEKTAAKLSHLMKIKSLYHI